MLTGNKRVELSTLFIFVKMMVYIYILLVYNSDQEVEVNLNYTYKGEQCNMSKHRLTPPCTYQGGKQRYSKQIVDIIFEQNNITENTKFYDLCCGSGSITLELISRGVKPENITMVDKSMWGEFWESIGSGEFYMESFEEELKKVPLCQSEINDFAKTLSLEGKSVYTYLILQSCSFGGKQVDFINNEWRHSGFRKYWTPTETSVRQSPVNAMQPSATELLKRIKAIVEKCKGVKAIKCDIENFTIANDEETIVYIDPPYANTTGYNHVLNIQKFCLNTKCKTYVSESAVLSDNHVFLNESGAKGGITAKKKQRTLEVLNIFN